jgi:hypothetical protein
MLMAVKIWRSLTRESVEHYTMYMQQPEEAEPEVEEVEIAVGSILPSASVDTDEATLLVTADEAVPTLDAIVAKTNSV